MNSLKPGTARNTALYLEDTYAWFYGIIQRGKDLNNCEYHKRLLCATDARPVKGFKNGQRPKISHTQISF